MNFVRFTGQIIVRNANVEILPTRPISFKLEFSAVDRFWIKKTNFSSVLSNNRVKGFENLSEV